MRPARGLTASRDLADVVAQPVARKAAESAAEHNMPLRRVKRAN
jgi:hypothetical protein